MFNRLSWFSKFLAFMTGSMSSERVLVSTTNLLEQNDVQTLNERWARLLNTGRIRACEYRVSRR